MTNLNRKLDIMKVIIAPVYKLNSKNGHTDINSPYVHSNKWVAIYPIPGRNFRSFYNLSKDFEKINLKSDIITDEEVVDLNNSKLLTEYFKNVKNITNKRYITYKKLLYIIIPIAQHEKYKNSNMKKRRKFVSLSNKFLTTDLYYKNHTEYNAIVEKKNYFAIDIENNEPVSYGYVSDDIPYVLRKRR